MNDFKNFNLIVPGYDEYLFKRRAIGEGVQYIFKFPNGYGASVLKTPGSFGYKEDAWELAVVLFDKKEPDVWKLCFTTAITDDVIGNLPNGQVQNLLGKIKAL